jgi:hypothetical protein
MMRLMFVGALLATLVGAPSFAQQNQAALERVLLESALWGPDFLVVLPHLQALRESGETTAFVFVDRLAGANAFETRQAAQAPVTRVVARIARPAQLNQRFQAARAQVPAPPVGAVRAAAETLIDGDGFHISITRAPALRLLAPGLTIQTVEARLGPPERITHQTIQGRGERRPVILTLYVYAGGAVAFAESNMADPGVVERVVLNLTTVAPLVAQ